MKQVLITGGTGFIGSRLALKLLEQGHPVKALGRENNPYEAANSRLLRAAGAEVLLASVTDRDAMFDALMGVDVVYHLAAAQHEANVPERYFWDINLRGAQNLLGASVSAGVERFVYGSTIGVYGSAPGSALNESSPASPDNLYGTTKLAAERLVLSYADVLPVTAVRISETYGPGDQRLLRLSRAICKGRFVMIGDGENLHHPVFIDDLIDGLRLAASREEALGRVFVLAGREPVTTNRMVEEIACRTGAGLPRARLPMSVMAKTASAMGKALGPAGVQPPLHPRRLDFFRKSLTFSTGAARESLGFEPRHGFGEGIEKTLRWYREGGYLPGLPSDGAAPPPSGRRRRLTARMEPFDSYWEGPSDVEKGYSTLGTFYRSNYLRYLPADRSSRALVVSCGPGYFVNMLREEGYTSVLGIDSDPRKVRMAAQRGLDCIAEEAFPFLEERSEEFDLIFCESEINHLTKGEVLEFFGLCQGSLRPGGVLICHSMNGANPITGAEGLALNIDHFNTFTEYSMRQLFEYSGFREVEVAPLELYVFYNNPLNYAGMAADRLLTLSLRAAFTFYGKSNRLFTKKIAGIGRKGQG